MIEHMSREASAVTHDSKGLDSGDQATYCARCGAQNAQENRFCVQCGAEMSRPVDVQTDRADAAATRDALPIPSVTPPTYKACGCPRRSICVHDPLVGFGPRFVALIIDAIVIGLVAGLLRGVDLRAMASLADAVYFVAFWSTTGQTVGMRVLRIKVVRIDEQPLSLTTGILRYVGYVLSIIPFCLGLLWVLWDPNRQGWHDKMAGTVVVRAE